MQCLLDTTRESNWLGSVINGPITDEMRIAQRQELTALQQTTRTTALPSGQTETLLYLLDGLLCWNFTVFTSFNAKIKEWYLGSLKDMSFAPLNPFSLFNFMDCAPYAPSLLESTVFCTRPDMSFLIPYDSLKHIHNTTLITQPTTDYTQELRAKETIRYNCGSSTEKD